ncbi:hypothetical protein RO3G_00865 [Rhizopus delemar RA 99-880]|uniref:Uncharacterized protein n=1 Tax=Rhizopus delemar (strain RA 99-880 / ATCC MYA-4621 / FGSC 9543 / NRRL 43880) TaxID=246409 RepID=I1BIY1_RHIO9|nr:hypothetical protein RO3G_00865 [Rhizopus delemar RA 99-880]|eukprot:EIE76161.1 hypothetical protein RO3G_00865 [Rhizopus delemar RA 99-880]
MKWCPWSEIVEQNLSDRLGCKTQDHQFETIAITIKPASNIVGSKGLAVRVQLW